MLVSRASATQNIEVEHRAVCSRHSIAVCVASIIPKPAERQSSDLIYIYIIPSHRMVKIMNDAMWTDERARVEADVGLLLLYPKLEMLQSKNHHKLR